MPSGNSPKDGPALFKKGAIWGEKCKVRGQRVGWVGGVVVVERSLEEKFLLLMEPYFQLVIDIKL